jgi:hypothetical protein
MGLRTLAVLMVAGAGVWWMLRDSGPAEAPLANTQGAPMVRKPDQGSSTAWRGSYAGMTQADLRTEEYRVSRTPPSADRMARLQYLRARIAESQAFVARNQRPGDYVDDRTEAERIDEEGARPRDKSTIGVQKSIDWEAFAQQSNAVREPAEGALHPRLSSAEEPAEE